MSELQKPLEMSQQEFVIKRFLRELDNVRDLAAAAANVDVSPLMNSKEAAEFLKCDSRAINRAIQSGLRYIEGIGKGRRFRKIDLIEYRDRLVKQEVFDVKFR